MVFANAVSNKSQSPVFSITVSDMSVCVASQSVVRNPLFFPDQNQNLMQKHDNAFSNDEKEEMHKVSRVKMISQTIINYRNSHGLMSIVPILIRFIAEPGFEDCIDDSRVFHTMFKDPKLDPMKVSESIWADHRPLVLTRLACGPLKTIENIGSTQITRCKGAFPFLKLPGELRNKVYVYMLRPTNNLKDLSGKTSDWCNPAIFCTSRQIRSESSSAIYKEQITVVVDPMAVACSRKGLHKLPEKSRFERCWIDVDMSDPRLIEGRTINYTQDDKPISSNVFHLLVEDLKMMKFLEELRLSCKRATGLHDTYEMHYFKVFCEKRLDCFRKLKGLKKVFIEGDLEEAYVAELLNEMNKPPIDFIDRQGRETVRKSQCHICSLPAGDYLQVEDKPKDLSGHTCDRWCRDNSCPVCTRRVVGCSC